MRGLGLAGVGNSRTVRTTRSAKGVLHSGDKLERDFTAPASNRRWVADITHVSTWSGFVSVAFVMDLFSRAIVGWRVDTSLRTDLALDALEHGLWKDAARTTQLIVSCIIPPKASSMFP